MAFRTTLVHRTSRDGHTIVTDDVLEALADVIRQKGTITITDPDENQHEYKVLNIDVTKRGLEAYLSTEPTAKIKRSPDAS